jgi:hypothetical protein
VQWEITAEPFQAFNCHCNMCRKAHGSAFATYWFFIAGEVNWLGRTDTIVKYVSSHFLTRSFCGTCGSVVPYQGGQSDHWVVPGGCHDDGKTSDCHVFAAHCAPWYDITGDLPQHDHYPDYTTLQHVQEEPLEQGPEGLVRGSCLCGAVEFRVSEPFSLVQNCHCHRCRKARAAAHATNGFTSLSGVSFVLGEDNLVVYKVACAKYFTQVFCQTCGSKMPRIDPDRGIAEVPFGGLDDEPNVKPCRHIYTDYKAKWYDITDDLPVYKGGPTD